MAAALQFPRWDYVPFSEMLPLMLPHIEWLGRLIEAIGRSTLHDWTAMLTDGNMFGLERFTAVLSVDTLCLARLYRDVFDRAKAGSQF